MRALETSVVPVVRSCARRLAKPVRQQSGSREREMKIEEEWERKKTVHVCVRVPMFRVLNG